MLRRPRASSFETRFSQAKIQDDHVIVVNVVSILTFPRATPAGHDEQGGSGDQYELSEKTVSTQARFTQRTFWEPLWTTVPQCWVREISAYTAN